MRSNDKQTNAQTSKSSQVEHDQRSASNQSSGLFSYMLWLFFLGGLSGSAYLLYSKSKSNEENISKLEREIDRVADGKLDRDNNPYQKLNRKLKERESEIEEYKKGFKRLENEVEEIRYKLSLYDSKADSKSRNFGNSENLDKKNKKEDISKSFDRKNRANNYDLDNSNRVDSKPNKTLFFSVPSQDGEFEHRKGQEEYEDRKLYKIIYQEGKSDGKIEYISGELDGHAINHKDSMLKPVCNIKETVEQNPTRIKMLKPGKVRLNGNEWVIQDKLKIEII
jgi:hypothetical protein